jgi:26S proteasome regulatory subunit N5
MSSGEVLKADKDFSKETDAAIPEAEKLGAVRVKRSRNSNIANSNIRATRKLASTTCLPSRRRRARYTTSLVAP